MIHSSHQIVACLLALAALSMPEASHAGSIYKLSLDTSLINNNGPDAPYSLAFDLIDGDNHVNNTALLSGFDYHGGAATGPPNTFGDATGQLGAAARLGDASGFNSIDQTFKAGSFFDVFVE